MAQTVLQRLRASIFSSGKKAPLETRDYTPSELASLRRQLKETNAEARAEVRRRGTKLHPKIAAARSKTRLDPVRA